MSAAEEWNELKKTLPVGCLAISRYRDKQFHGNKVGYFSRLLNTTTLYIGNLSFYTTEEQIYELFGKCGLVRRVIMGLDRFKKTPCGFCFVEYYSKEGCENAIRFLSGLRLDDRIIRVDWDAGFEEGRQFGRGRSGGQVRDEVRSDFDTGRGGWGKLIQQRTSDEAADGTQE